MPPTIRARESFDGELARFLMYERPLTNDELRQTMESSEEDVCDPTQMKQ